MNSELEAKTPAQELAENLNLQMNRAIDASGLRPYLARELRPFTAVSERVEGYANAVFEVSFGVSVEMLFRHENFFGEGQAPHAEVGMASIGQHSASMALARSTLYAKAAQAAALFDAGATYAYDSFLRAEARAAKVVA